MPNFKDGYEAWIEVDGIRLEEYALGEFLDPQGVPVLESWVACVAGKKFKIGLSIPVKKVKATHHALTVSMDGSRVKVVGDCVRREQRTEPMVVYFDKEVSPDGDATRHFQFGELKSTEAPSFLERNVEHLGTIELSITSVVKLTRKPAEYSEEEWEHDGVVHERHMAKNGLIHCIQFGEADALETDLKEDYVSVGYSGTHKVCSFQFCYRDKGESDSPMYDCSS